MSKDSHIDFSRIDDQLLDGLDFCSKVYDLFDQISREPDGKSRLRLLSKTDKRFTDKRLVEELLPLARHIQTRYQAGRRIKVRWSSGSQQYDAVLWSSGSLVKHGGAPRKVFVEITTSVHPNDHLKRQLLEQRGGSFGVKGIYRERKSGTIVSKPYVFSGSENAEDLAKQILARLSEKAKKGYPPNTVLIINCVTNCLILEDEWTGAVEQIRKACPRIEFREVFLVDMLMSHTTTLYGDRKRARRSKGQKATL
jgi:hypothetical protein